MNVLISAVTISDILTIKRLKEKYNISNENDLYTNEIDGQVLNYKYMEDYKNIYDEYFNTIVDNAKHYY